MMKNLCIAVSLSLLLSIAAIAQVGIKAGANLSKTAVVNVPVVYDEFSQPDAKLSYQAGGFAVLPFHERISMQVELLYTNKGERSSVARYKTNQHYINLPVLLQYKVIDKLKIEAGPEVGYLLAAYSRSLSGQTGSKLKLNTVKDFDLGVDMGVSYELLEKFMIGLRYNVGLYSIVGNISFIDVQGNIIADNIKLQNRSLQLSVGYKLFE